MPMTAAELDAWRATTDRRLDVLEGKPQESPNGATVSIPGANLIVLGVTWSITADKKLMRNGQRREETSQVALIFRHADSLVQQNTSLNYYRAAAVGDWSATSQGAWTQLPGDPRVPPVVTGAPAPAVAAGYNTRTLGPQIIVGSTWFRNNMYGMDPAAMNVTQLTDGRVLLAGPWSYNGQIITTSILPGGSFKGIAFGGGAYMEATLSFTGGYTGDGGWPAFWSHDIEGLLGNGSTQWPGQSAGYVDEIEPDFMEYWGDRTWGSTIHNWYGGGDVLETDRNFTLPSGVDRAQPQRYGALWTPATGATRGSMSFWFNGVVIPGWTITWNQYNPTLPPPPVRGTSAYSVLDRLHLALILGTGANNPMTVQKVEVWQKSAAGNLIRP